MEFKPEHRIQFHCDQILLSTVLSLGGPQICLLSAAGLSRFQSASIQAVEEEEEKKELNDHHEIHNKETQSHTHLLHDKNSKNN